MVPPLDGLESTLHKHMKMHNASFCTGHIDVIDENDDKSAWAELLKGRRLV